jgi:hypothetical protein
VHTLSHTDPLFTGESLTWPRREKIINLLSILSTTMIKIVNDYDNPNVKMQIRNDPWIVRSRQWHGEYNVIATLPFNNPQDHSLD